MVTFTINIPQMLAYIPAPWILWGWDPKWRQTCHGHFSRIFRVKLATRILEWDFSNGTLVELSWECGRNASTNPADLFQKRALSIIKLNQKTCGGVTTQVITISHPFFGGIPIDVGHIHPRRCTTNMSTPDEAKPCLVRMVNLPIRSN